VGSDAEIAFSVVNNENYCAAGNFPIGVELSLTKPDKFFNPVPISSPNLGAYTYQYQITGAGPSLKVRLVDSPYDDNYGQFQITITPQ
jgi:hypothetical protein